MYTSFFGLQEKPFAITPDPRYLYLSERHAEALAHLLYGINEAGGFIQLTGEVGTGKTTVIRSLLEQLPGHADVALILNPRITPAEFLLTICEELHVPVPEAGRGSTKTLMDVLGRHLLDTHARGRRVVLIVDEAQNLSTQTLEQVRLLTNLETATTKLLQIILIGQPELRDLLDKPELRQLAQRITGRYHLNPLSAEESAGYVKHRMRVAGATAEAFTPAALREVYRLASGVPRVINVICDRALLGAFTKEDHRVGGALVRQAASEVYGRPIPAPWLKWGTAAAVAAAVALVAVGLVSLWSARKPTAATAEVGAPAAAATASVEATAPPPVQPAAATVPAPAPQVSLDELLARHANDTTTEAALAKLFSLWGVTLRRREGPRLRPSRASGPRVPVPEGLVGAAAHPESPGDPDADGRRRPHAPGRVEFAVRRIGDVRIRRRVATGADRVGVALLVRRFPAAVAATDGGRKGPYAGHARRGRAVVAREPAHGAGAAGARRAATPTTTT